MVKLKKLHWWLLAFNLIFLVVMMFIFWQRRNYEFMIGGLFTLLMIFIVIKLHQKYEFSDLTLVGLSLLAIAHKLGGGIILMGLHYMASI